MRVIYDSGGRIVATEHRVDGSYTAHNLPEDYAGQPWLIVDDDDILLNEELGDLKIAECQLTLDRATKDVRLAKTQSIERRKTKLVGKLEANSLTLPEMVELLKLERST